MGKQKWSSNYRRYTVAIGQNSFFERVKRYSFGVLLNRVVDKTMEKLFSKVWTARFKMKCFLKGIHPGKNTSVFGKVIVRVPDHNIVFGNNVVIVSSSWRCNSSSLATITRFRTFFSSAKILIGDDVGFNGTSITARSKTITICDKVGFAADCIVMDSDFHVPWPPEERNSYSGNEIDQDVYIGKNVWIGTRCIILRGANIGENSIISAGSVVIGKIPPNTLAAGNPARVIKKLD